MARVVNLYHEDYDVYIGRGSEWGNPFKLDDFKERSEVIEKYEIYIREKLENSPELRGELKYMKDKTLGCFCKPLACHGDILVQIRNPRRHSNSNRRDYCCP